MHATLRERPEAEQAAARRAAVSRRHRILCAVLLPLVAFVAGATYVGTYEPFANGGGVFNAGLDGGGFQELRDGVVGVTSDGDPEITVVDPPVGSRFGVLLTLTNDGRFPVDVVGVELPVNGGYYLNDPLSYVSLAPGGSGLPMQPFVPFSLSPGQGRDVGVSYRLSGCEDGPTTRGAGTNTFPWAIVTWRFAGLTRISEVPLYGVAGISGLPQCASVS